MLMEAMADGVPVVATRIAGIPELVQDGQQGTLVPPGDPDATAQAIRSLLDDPDLRNRYAIAGRQKVQQDFDLRRNAAG